MFNTVLIANRGEIAARIVRTLKRLGVRAIGVASDADRFTAPMRMADAVAHLSGNTVAETYLNMDAIIAACREFGAEAVHPGYGFLSENPRFPERLAVEGIKFIGPKPEAIRAFGLKHTAREIAEKNGILLLPGSGLLESAEQAIAEAARIGYPVMLKSTAGGGGIGMQLCRDADELSQRYANVARLASSNFGDARMYLERFVSVARHVEVQIFGDGKGGIVALGERDCSCQRRNQKVVEETPAPNLPARVREELRAAAIALGKAVNYESAGTVEFVYDAARTEAYFLEVNTRLQVEHPVTEEIFGVDLVEWMVRQAAGEFTLPAPETLWPRGHAIEVRIYAEDPARDFRPSTGLITALDLPTDVRLESWIQPGEEVSPYYDPMLAKLIARGEDRNEALEKLDAALDAAAIWGIETNIDYLKTIAASDFFRTGDVATSKLKGMAYAPRSIEVLTPGTQSSLQDWPGRLGYWNVGIPPSGPMDDRSHRLVNRILGNAENAATLECTLTGPALKFHTDAVFALGGAEMAASLDSAPLPYWQPIKAKRGQVLILGAIAGAGLRTYLGIEGGFDAPLYLGSRATFSLGLFGGHAGRVLKAGDMLRIGSDAPHAPYTPPEDEKPALTREWRLGVLYGPHGAPDFFTPADIEALFATEYEVHFNSARTGVRLIGPAPKWARSDGGEAGLHPSNIHDNAYAIGAIDFTGDMPIILGPDGPSLGGFVCPAALAQGELWKLGQLRPGDKVRFVNISLADAAELKKGASLPPARPLPETDRLRKVGDIVYRRSGDDNILVEFGPMQLDLTLRLRAHLLMQALQSRGPKGIIDLTPGIRSLQIHYDNGLLTEGKLLDTLAGLQRELPDPAEAVVQSRTVHLPLSWNDPQAQLAMRKYRELVRPNAPWCPSNIEFIRRINGLSSEEDVRRIVFDAEYLVLGLGDVYLGAPVATPVDPRHRLVTTKYNPARTWTPENAVGIGGAYLCVYGMEGPGGYQLFGRTVQMWNRWRTTECFEEPWLLRFFDRIKFFPVSGEELLEARAAFPHGAYALRIEERQFALRDYQRFLAANAAPIAAAKVRQQAAFAAERERWRELGLDTFVTDEALAATDDDAIPAGATAVHAPTAATVWKIETKRGARVAAGDVLIVVESMKTEIAVPAPIAGVVSDIRCQPGRAVHSGQTLIVIEDAR
jgi:urea carboxylase